MRELVKWDYNCQKAGPGEPCASEDWGANNAANSLNILTKGSTWLPSARIAHPFVKKWRRTLRYTRDCLTERDTHCNSEREEFLVDSRDKPDRTSSVSDASWKTSDLVPPAIPLKAAEITNAMSLNRSVS